MQDKCLKENGNIIPCYDLEVLSGAVGLTIEDLLQRFRENNGGECGCCGQNIDLLVTDLEHYRAILSELKYHHSNMDLIEFVEKRIMEAENGND